MVSNQAFNLLDARVIALFELVTILIGLRIADNPRVNVPLLLERIDDATHRPDLPAETVRLLGDIKNWAEAALLLLEEQP